MADPLVPLDPLPPATTDVSFILSSSNLDPDRTATDIVTLRRSKKKRKSSTSLWVSTRTPTSTLYWRSGLSPAHPPPSARLPIPPIRARPRRPHAIHIVAYPPGFVPYDLRSQNPDAVSASEPNIELDPACPTDTAPPTDATEQSAWTRLSLSRPKPRPDRSSSRAFTPPRKLRSRRTAPLRQSSAWAGFGKILSATFHHGGQGHGSNSNLTQPPSYVPVAPISDDGQIHEPMARLASSVKFDVTSLVKELSKPVATGSGVTCSIILAEPNLFLSGFDHDGRRPHPRNSQAGTALLRGTLRLSVTKNVKIKAVQLKLIGRARTEWPEGLPPQKQQTFEEEVLRTQVLTFFNALNDGWETDYGNQCIFALKMPSSSCPSSTEPFSISSSASPSLRRPPTVASSMTAKELRRLSFQPSATATSLSLGLGRDDLVATQTQLKGYRVFYPGRYDYSFELPIDHHQLETTKLPYGSVRWELQATVDRAGAFKPNLHGSREVSIVRVPDQLSLETTEPISISRQWEDQLYYDIAISGKSFPIGSRIPIAFRLTPLAKVRIHKLKVYVSETVEYWTSDRRVARREPGRKILLLEKTAGRPLDPAYNTSELRILSGGERSPSERRDARLGAAAILRATAPQAPPLPEQSDNLLGDLDLGLEEFWGPTELEASVQMPTCVMMARNKDLTLNPDCSWKNANVYHWIKVYMPSSSRISVSFIFFSSLFIPVILLHLFPPLANPK